MRIAAKNNRVVVGSLAVLLWASLPAWAQTGPEIMIKPWDNTPHWAETFDQPIIMNQTHIKTTGERLKMWYYDSHGRVKFDHDNPDPDFEVGYSFVTAEIDTKSELLTGGYSDLSLVGAVKLGELTPGWQLKLLGGLGTSNDNSWGNGDAIYGIGALDAGHVLDESSTLHIGLGYNGNRVLVPDAPLPYVVYNKQLNQEFSFTLGLPYYGFKWQPTEQFTLEAGHMIPMEFRARAAYTIVKGWSLFAAFEHSANAFHRQGHNTDRLFYRMDRAMSGVRWVWDPWIDLSVGVGYALNQNFSTGYDLRDTDTVAEPVDTVFIFFTIQGNF